MATITAEIGRQVALDRIRVPENVRALDPEHVKALAGSIALQGMLVPVVVRDDGENGLDLVAGFHRVAAARSLGLVEVPVVVRDAVTEDADRAVENITSVGSARGAWAARHVLARLAWFPPAATSNRACDFPAHGSPTFFTAGIQRPRRHGRLARGATMVPSRLISPSRSGDWWMTAHQPYRPVRL